ncbi:MAG: carbohydrate porin [Planctomycetota bacterium]
MHRPRHSFPSALLLTAALAGQEPGAPADTTPEPKPREWIGGLPYPDWTRATGDWFGLRTRCEDAGIEFGGGYTADLAAPWSGDTRRRSSAVSLVDVNVALDLETLAGLPRTLVYVDAYQIEGRNPSDDVGDFQGFANIATENTDQIAEVWVETWLADLFRIKVGKVDFNSEFAFHEIGGEFVNSTPAILPTIVAYPTYPDPATAVNVFLHPDERWTLGVAVYDGALGNGISTGGRGPKGFFSDDESDAYFLCAEAGYAWPGGESWGAGRLVLGGFHHTARFTTFAGNPERGTSGLWTSLEQRCWRENPADDDGQGLGVFALLGLADEDVAGVGSVLGLGAEWTGPLPSRDADVLGLGVFHCALADDPNAGTPDDETTIELLYKLALTPAISLKPEVQYILNPGGVGTVDDVLVGLVRLEILF